MLKHVFKALKRNKVRNIFITLIMFVIMTMSCIALSIHTTANEIRDEQKAKYGSRAFIDLSDEALQKLSSGDGNSFLVNYPKLDNDLLLAIAKSEVLKDSSITTSLSARTDSLEIPKLDNGQTTTSGMMLPSIGTSGGQAIPNEEMPNIQVHGYDKTQETSYFREQNKKLIEGEFPINQNEAIVSQALAKLNELEIGDTFTMKSSHFNKEAAEPKEMEITVTGIYQKIPSSDQQDQFFFSQEDIFTLNETVLAKEYNNDVIVNATYYLHSPNDLEAFQKDATSMGLSDDYTVKTDANAYESIIAPIDGIAQVAFIFLWIVLLLGGSLLVLLTMFHIRERNFEIGILRSLGMKRKSIITQMILEPLCLAALALCLGYGAGMISAQPISDQLLQQQMNKDSQGSMNISGSIIISASQDTPIDEMTLSFSTEVFIQLCTIACFLIFLSGGLSALYIVKYEPMQILSERR